MKKKIIALVLAIAALCSVFTVSAMAANYSTNYKAYSQPSTSGDYAYWNGKKVVRAPGTTVSEVKWMQSALNYCVDYKNLNAGKLNVDGSFGPASKAATMKFQSKYGLSADGSFGPATIKKMISVLNTNTKSSGGRTSQSKALSVNMNYIKATGYQPNSGPCGCYALAYARDILDGKTHSWTEYSASNSPSWNTYNGVREYRYSYTASWSKANYTAKTGNSNQAVFKAVYDSINNGKPVVVRVTGNGSSGHYITLVGYQNVTDVNALSAKNFLMIDPVKSLFEKGITPMTSGSTGYSLASSYQYVVAK